ncbi:MAG: hprK [Acidobacteria bacterium]|nr:hprK [Acidobacteriota bacterium]
MSGRVPPVTTRTLLGDPRLAGLGLQVIAGAAGLDRTIRNPRLQKPGLALAGHLDYVKEGRVQVIGASETQFLATLDPATARERVAALIARQPPLVLVTKGMDEHAANFVAPCEEYGVPLTVSPVTTSRIIERLSFTLELLLAEREVRHGDLLDIFAIGVLLLGESGLGKSECALELVHRGSVSVRDSKPIDLVIRLVPGSTLHLERLGLAESTEEFLGVSRPCLSVPVAAGRSLGLLVECAARKYLLGQRGVPDLAKEFLMRHDRQLERP